MAIEDAAELLKHTPLYGPAAFYLLDYMNLVNENSDGWAYWKAGSQAAEPLQKIVSEGVHLVRPWGAYAGTKPTATEADVRLAVNRIHRFISSNKYLANIKAPELNLAVQRRML